MDIIQDANIYFEERRNAIMSSTVTYSRADFKQDFLATMSESSYTEINSNDVQTDVKYADFIFVNNMFYPIFGNPIVGDSVIHTINGEIRTYEVRSPSGDTHFAKDAYNLSITVHTQKIKTEPC